MSDDSVQSRVNDFRKQVVAERAAGNIDEQTAKNLMRKLDAVDPSLSNGPSQAEVNRILHDHREFNEKFGG